MEPLDAIRKDHHRSRMTGRLAKLTSFISYPAKVLTGRFENLTTWKQDVTEEATRIPTFYGAEIGSNSPAQLALIALPHYDFPLKGRYDKYSYRF